MPETARPSTTITRHKRAKIREAPSHGLWEEMYSPKTNALPHPGHRKNDTWTSSTFTLLNRKPFQTSHKEWTLTTFLLSFSQVRSSLYTSQAPTQQEVEAARAFGQATTKSRQAPALVQLKISGHIRVNSPHQPSKPRQPRTSVLFCTAPV